MDTLTVLIDQTFQSLAARRSTDTLEASDWLKAQLSEAWRYEHLRERVEAIRGWLGWPAKSSSETAAHNQNLKTKENR